MLFLLSPRVLWIYSVTGEWVYPLFASFSPAGLGAFFISSLAIVVCFYNFGEFLNRMIWGQSNFCFYFYPCEKKKIFPMITKAGGEKDTHTLGLGVTFG